jgi:predicted 2-oxoglutarate/Fe(II)-dependent dioxygenase YbiX
MQISDFILKKNFIPKKTCEEIIKNLDNNKWEEHLWFDPKSKKLIQENKKELLVQHTTDEFDKIVFGNLLDAIKLYNQTYASKDNYKCSQLFTSVSKIRWNKYLTGACIDEHYDHIHSIFDGTRRGIPVVSIVGLLNDDFKGGNFIIAKKKIKLKAGDIIMFPSCFMYPHEVTEVTSGNRYSFVSWAF